MNDYNLAFYPIQDIRDAEQKSRGIIGNENIKQLLEQMELFGITEIPWFRLADSDRDIISDYCGIQPKFKVKSTAIKFWQFRFAGETGTREVPYGKLEEYLETLPLPSTWPFKKDIDSIRDLRLKTIGGNS